MDEKHIGLPSSEGILKTRYTDLDIRILKKQGKVTCAQDSRTYLADVRTENGVEIEERVILNSRSGRPWFASKSFYNVREEAKLSIYESIEMMTNKTKRTIFRTSPDSNTIIVNALRSRGKPLTDTMVKYIKEIEAIVIAQDKMLNVD